MSRATEWIRHLIMSRLRNIVSNSLCVVNLRRGTPVYSITHADENGNNLVIRDVDSYAIL